MININIAELLKDAPVGLQLYSPLFGPVVFKGISNSTIVVKGNCSQYFDKYGRPCGFLDADCLLFPSKELPTWEGWTAPIKPKFKVGDWLVYKDGQTFCQNSKIVQVQAVEKDRYTFTQGTTGSCRYIDSYCRLWTPSDIEDGDILMTINVRCCPFIYRKTDYNKDFAYYYAGINGDGDFCEGCIERTLYHFGFLTNVVPASKEQRDKLFNKMKEAGYTWNSQKKELSKIVEPSFKVGDWITNGLCTIQISSIGYEKINGALCMMYYHNNNTIGGDVESIDKEYHLWTVEDAQDGDILISELGNPFIYDGKIGLSFLGAYVGISRNGEIKLDLFPNKSWTGFINVKPATKEQQELLLTKLKEIGYEWDKKNKELKKIQPHYDISNFHADMPVLVRDKDNCKWCYLLYSHYDNTYDDGLCFNAGSVDWRQCIPFNDDTKHLLGTTDKCPEKYVNW